MIDFKEELKKFKPSLEIDSIEETIKSNDIKDIIDLLTYISKNIEDQQQNKE
ncbi:hypothetical protein [Defluviitalea phaphyphila]|uniref:hypothetical protein n=1 Tax=Defluviitalea phaphyphila TaxID=1473580 RepID=UPI000B2BFD68|nr:hypothetical protein [Defluviitalea phaphyphila]